MWLSPPSGTLSFHIRRRPADYQPRKRKKKPSSHGGVELPGPASPQGLPQGVPQGVVPQGGFRCGSLYDRLPFLLAVHPDGGQPGPRHRILLNMTEVGSAPSGTQCLQVRGMRRRGSAVISTEPRSSLLCVDSS